MHNNKIFFVRYDGDTLPAEASWDTWWYSITTDSKIDVKNVRAEATEAGESIVIPAERNG